MNRAAIDDDTLGATCETIRERLTRASLRDLGGFMPPTAVARLMASLVDPRESQTVYDPTCGSGAMLAAACRHVERAGGQPRKLGLFGEDRHGTLARLSLLLHGVDHGDLVYGDSLVHPEFLGSQRFDVVLGNPPFSLPWRDGYWETVASRPELRRYGRPPRNRCDFAFLLHMLASLAEDGKLLTLMSPGALYRRGVEADIRRGLLQDDLVEAVVDLGPGLFQTTPIPVVFMLLRRRKPSERRGKVLLIRSEPPRKTGRRKHELDDERAARILAAAQHFSDSPGFSRVVTLDEIARQEHNLSLSLYLESGHVPPMQVVRAGPEIVVPRSGELTLADAVREAEAALAAARQSRASIEQALLTRGLAGTTRPHFELGEVPGTWEFVTLDQLGVELRDGTLAPKPDGNAAGRDTSRAPDLDEFWGPSPAPRMHPVAVSYIRQTQLSPDGDVDFAAAEVVELPPREHERFAVHAGDLLLRRVHGSMCGKAALVTAVPPRPAVFAAGITRIRVDPGAIDPLLFMCWLHHPPVRAALLSRASRGVKISVNHRALRGLPWPRVPAKDRPALVVELHALRAAVMQAAQHLALLHDAHDAVTGRRSGGRRCPSRPDRR